MLRYECDGDFTLKGYPGENAAAFLPSVQLGINADCPHPEQAWVFLRTLLLPTFQDGIYQQLDWAAFPARRDSLQKAAALSRTDDYMRTHATTPPYLGDMQLTDSQLAYWHRGVDAADCQLLLDAMEHTTLAIAYDAAVTDILFEEADVFFNGDCTAAAAAAAMQDRIQTYLNEQG